MHKLLSPWAIFFPASSAQLEKTHVNPRFIVFSYCPLQLEKGYQRTMTV